jgi:DNA repair photolyase
MAREPDPRNAVFRISAQKSKIGHADLGAAAQKEPPKAALHGRGARTNVSGRYEQEKRDAFDDGWSDDPPDVRKTDVTIESARTIISRNQSPDISFSQSLNPYRGCEHGCIYCYARPNHAYAGLSPGLDFETKLFAKTNAPELLEAEFSKRSYEPAVLMMGGVTDIYQPIEREHQITRRLIEVCARWRQPIALITKSQLVMRDIDLLAPMAAQNLAKVAISLTTLDRRIARVMEPRAAAPHRRLEAIRALTSAGIPVTVMTAPIVPAINDSEIENLLEEAHKAGAHAAGYVILRLPLEIKDLFREWLAEHFPDRAARVMSLVRQMRGGRDYDPAWGVRQKGTGPYAQLIAHRFQSACRRLGLNTLRFELDSSRFRKPPEAGDQQDLFAVSP